MARACVEENICADRSARRRDLVTQWQREYFPGDQTIKVQKLVCRSCRSARGSARGKKNISSSPSLPYRDPDSGLCTPFVWSDGLVYRGQQSKNDVIQTKLTCVFEGPESRLAPTVQRWIDSGKFTLTQRHEEEFCRLVGEVFESEICDEGGC